MDGTPHVHEVKFQQSQNYDQYGKWFLIYGDTQVEVFPRYHNMEEMTEETLRACLLTARDKAVIKHDQGTKAAVLARQKELTARSLRERVVAELQPPPVSGVWWSEYKENPVPPVDPRREESQGLWNHKVMKFVTIR